VRAVRTRSPGFAFARTTAGDFVRLLIGDDTFVLVALVVVAMGGVRTRLGAVVLFRSVANKVDRWILLFD